MRITRIFIDNYKCFVGFDFKPQAIQPIFGLNGTGKSTLFEVLAGVRRAVVAGDPIDFCFPEAAFTRWTRFPPKPLRIMIEVGGDDDWQYRYELTASIDRATNKTRIVAEVLTSPFFSEPLYSFRDGTAALLHDLDKSSQQILANEQRSGLASVNQSPGTHHVHTFRNWLKGVQWVALHPGLCRQSISQSESAELEWGGVNFVSWLRHIVQTRLAAMGELRRDLGESIDGLNAINLDSLGKQRVLRATFTGWGKSPVILDFDELSDGQRMLIALYAVLHGLKGTNAVVCIDEPANYLALAEIQPYLLRLRDAVGDGIAQLFVVTHNPEAINDLAPDHPALFTRADDGSIQVLPFPETNPEGLTAAELIARGWEQP
jgi:predicted ATPase